MNNESNSLISDKEPKKPILELLIVYIITILLLNILLSLKITFFADYVLFCAAILFVYLPAFVVRKEKDSLKIIGLKSNTLIKDIKFALIFTLVFLFIYSIGFHFHIKILTAMKFNFNLPDNFIYYCINQLILIGIPEEVFYRGYVYNRLKKVSVKRWRIFGVDTGWYLIVSSLLFALGHFLVGFNLMRLGVFFPSLVFGWLRDKTGNIYASAIFHASCNILMLCLQSSYK